MYLKKNTKIFAVGILSIILIIGSFYLTTAIIQNDTKKIGASEILLECEHDSVCIIKNIHDLAEIEDQKVVLSIVHEIVFTLDEDEFNCHEIAHHVGHFLYEYFDGDIVQTMSFANNKCGNALYHGIVENYLPDKVLKENIEIENYDVTIPCMEFEIMGELYIELNCIHGMGHSLAKVYNYDVIDAVLRCDEFQTLEEQEMCQDGLFMENSVEFFKNGGGDFDDEDIFYPCNKLDEKYHKKCYIYQGTHILLQNDFSASVSFEQCEKLSSEESIQSCYIGVARYMALIHSYSIEKSATMCKNVNLTYQKECIISAVELITLHIDSELGDDFCSQFTEDKAAYCIDKWYSTQKYENLT